MKTWPQALRDGALSGSVASVVSSVALAAMSRAQTGHALAAVNATSHWVWPWRAFWQNRFSLRYTGTGYLIHHGASVFWAVLCERFLAPDAGRTTARMASDAALTSVAAAIGDYVIAPKRITPGVEERLSVPAVGAFYLAFGAGLALGMLLLPRR